MVPDLTNAMTRQFRNINSALRRSDSCNILTHMSMISDITQPQVWVHYA